MENPLKTLGSIFMIVGAISGAFVYLNSTYSTVAAHTQLEQRVISDELDALREKALSEVYFLRAQSRKYPKDQELKDQLSKAEKRLDEIETKLKGEK